MPFRPGSLCPFAIRDGRCFRYTEYRQAADRSSAYADYFVMMSRVLRFVLSALLIFSAGCSSLEPLLVSLTPPSPVPTRTARATATPLPLSTETAVVEPEISSLRIWL